MHRKHGPSLCLLGRKSEPTGVKIEEIVKVYPRGGSVDPVYKKPFDLVAEGNVSGIWLPGEDSNLQPFG